MAGLNGSQRKAAMNAQISRLRKTRSSYQAECGEGPLYNFPVGSGNKTPEFREINADPADFSQLVIFNQLISLDFILACHLHGGYQNCVRFAGIWPRALNW